MLHLHLLLPQMIAMRVYTTLAPSTKLVCVYAGSLGRGATQKTHQQQYCP